MSEVSIDVQHSRIVPKRTNSDEAVDAGSQSDCCPARIAVQLDSFLEYVSRQRILEHRDVGKCRCRDVKSSFVINALQNFLHHWKACDDFITMNSGRVPIVSAPA